MIYNNIKSIKGKQFDLDLQHSVFIEGSTVKDETWKFHLTDKRILVKKSRKTGKILHRRPTKTSWTRIHEGEFTRADFFTLLDWLFEPGAGEIKIKVEKIIGKMQRKFARYRKRKGI